MRTLGTILLASCLAFGQSGDQVRSLVERSDGMVAAGQLDEAASLYQNALQKFPGDPEIAFQLGVVHFRQRNWTAAIGDFNTSLRRRPRDVKTLFYLAESYYLSQNLDLARQTIAEAAAIAPDDAQICQKYGEYLGAVLETRGEGLAQLRKAQHLNPHLPRIDFDIGKTQFDLTDFAAAAQSFEATRKSDPEDGEAAYYLAECRGKLGEWGKAKDSSSYAIAHHYATGPAYYDLGRALIELGDFQAAIDPLQRALGLQPSLIQAHFQLEKAYRQLGHLDDARRENRLFAAMTNRVDTSHEDRSPEEESAWKQVRPMVEAHDEMQALARLAKLPAPGDYGPAYSSYLLGEMYFSVGQKTDAERVLLAARKQAPQSAHLAAYLGLVQMSSGESGAAEKSFAAALALNPSETLALIGMGVIRYQQEQWQEAIRYLEPSRTADPGTLLMLCDAYFRVGDRDQALLTAEVIRAFGSNNPALLSALDDLVSRYSAEPAVGSR